ncbi:hypothetical protein ACJX0J_029021, partial [Zea mays]
MLCMYRVNYFFFLFGIITGLKGNVIRQISIQDLSKYKEILTGAILSFVGSISFIFVSLRGQGLRTSVATSTQAKVTVCGVPLQSIDSWMYIWRYKIHNFYLLTMFL